MAFDPKKHLMKVKGGADYLEVKWRLVWFREQFPAGVIESEALHMDDKVAIFRATVTAVDENGVHKGSATGYKRCTADQFKFGHIEKAETGAIGRALACLGFGTQFEPEFDEGDQIVDSPVERPQTARNAPKPANTTPDKGPDKSKVMARLHALASEAGLSHDDLRALVLAKVDGVESMSDAPVDVLVELGKRIAADPAPLKHWLAKQQELLPTEDVLPNPDRFTQ